MAAINEVKTRILIISDTHCALPQDADVANKEQLPFRKPLPKVDVLLHAGDLTRNGKLDQHQKAVELLKMIDAELKIVIPGNHDLTLDRDYYRQFPLEHWAKKDIPYTEAQLDECEQMYTNQEMKGAGIIYMLEDIRSFQLENGANFTVYASAYQPEFYNWAFGYERSQDRFNLPKYDAPFKAEEPVPDTGIDIMLTHGPPYEILDETSHPNKDGDNHAGCKKLLQAVTRCKPRLHAFGHIHEGWGAVKKDWTQEAIQGENRIPDPSLTETNQWMGAYYDANGLKPGQETLFVNASIMDVMYDPKQAPWIVDLMLPYAA